MQQSLSDRARTSRAVWDALEASQRGENPWLTVSQISDLTGLSRPTVSSILSDFQKRKLVVVGDGDNGMLAGRPAATWRLSSDAGIIVAVDVLVTTAALSVVSLTGDIRSTKVITLPDSAIERREKIVGVIRSAVKEAAPTSDLWHVAVSTTGIISEDGTVLASDLVPSSVGVNIADEFSRELHCSASVLNDIDAAAFGEFSSRRAAGLLPEDGDLLYVQIGRGIHTGLVLGGSVHFGSHRHAGEISDALGLRFSDAKGPDEQWFERATLTVASVGAVVDPEAIVMSSPAPESEQIISDLVDRIHAQRRPGTAEWPLQLGELGWSASLVGAIFSARDKAVEAITGLPKPVIAEVNGINQLHSELKKGRHSTMAPVLDEPADEPKSATLRVGIVGCGARARFVQAVERQENNGQIVAVVEPSPLARQRVEERLERDPDSVTIVSTVKELIDEGVDVAFVTSPDDTHADVTCELLEAGVPVYLEKPLAITLEGATRILETAYRTRTRLYVGHNMRHMHVVRKMRELIREGRIGQVKAIWCRHFVGSGGDFYFKDWHATREHGTGLLLQKAAHDIDVMHWLADSYTSEVVAMGGLTLYGDVEERADRSDQLMPEWHSLDNWPPLSNTGLNPVIDVEDLSMMLMQLQSGVFASYQQCHYTPDYWRNYTVIGTEGRLENFGDGEGGHIKLWNKRTYYNPDGDEQFPIIGDSAGHGDADVLTIAEFVRFVRTGAPTDTSPLGAWYAVAAGIQATESLRDGATPRQIPKLDEELISYFTHHQNSEK